MEKTRKGLAFIMHYYKGQHTIYCGTLEELDEEVFGYTLECGHSWNARIPRHPKTKQSFVNALNNSATETNDFSSVYSLSTKKEFLEEGGAIPESGHAYVSY